LYIVYCILNWVEILPISHSDVQTGLFGISIHFCSFYNFKCTI
jgi:hypothetical protein